MSATSTKPLTPVPAAATATLPPLRKNLQFQTLCVGTSMSTLGVSVATSAYPLAILALTGSPGKAGLFAAVEAAGMLVAGLPAGQLADNYDRRTIVIAAEAASAAVTGVIVVALVMGWLSLALLLGAAVLLGAGQAITGAARLPLMRSVVAPEQLTPALVQDEVRQGGAALAGPPIAGALYAIRALAHAVPFLFTAASFVVSLLAAVLMKVMPGGSQPEAGARSQPKGHAQAPAGEKQPGMLAGVRTIVRHPVLRSALGLFMLVNTLGAGMDLIIIVLLRHQHVHSSVIGLVLASTAVGTLAGAPLVKRLHRLPPGVLLISGAAILVPVTGLLALPFGPIWAGALLFVAMLSVPSLRVLLDVLILRQAPDEERGRIVAAVMVILGLGTPIGAGASGLMLEYLSPSAAMLTVAGALAVIVAVFASRRELVQARWPG
jgi:MFS family permease